MWGKRKNEHNVPQASQALAGLIDLLQQSASDGGGLPSRIADGFVNLTERAQKGEDAERLYKEAMRLLTESREHRSRRMEEATSNLYRTCRDLVESMEEAADSGHEVAAVAQRAVRNLRFLDERATAEDLRTAIDIETRELLLAVKSHELQSESTSRKAQAAMEQVRERLSSACSFTRIDPLTGLPNRRAFEGYLVSHLRDGIGPEASVALADVSDFAEVNANIGPTKADDLLKEVATRLKDALGTGGFVARLYGNTFGIAFTGSESELDARLSRWVESLPSMHGMKLDATWVYLSREICPSATTILSDLEDALVAAKRRKSLRKQTA